MITEPHVLKWSLEVHIFFKFRFETDMDEYLKITAARFQRMEIPFGRSGSSVDALVYGVAQHDDCPGHCHLCMDVQHINVTSAFISSKSLCYIHIVELHLIFLPSFKYVFLCLWPIRG